jgi:hypothetical protein
LGRFSKEISFVSTAIVFNSYGANEKSVSAVSLFTAETLEKHGA